MVCPRCITATRMELEKLNINSKSIDLGDVDILYSIVAWLYFAVKNI